MGSITEGGECLYDLTQMYHLSHNLIDIIYFRDRHRFKIFGKTKFGIRGMGAISLNSYQFISLISDAIISTCSLFSEISSLCTEYFFFLYENLYRIQNGARFIDFHVSSMRVNFISVFIDIINII